MLMRSFVPNAKARLIGMIGYPISSAQSPQLFNEAFAKKNINCMMVPLDAEPAHAKQTMEMFMLLQNSLGILVTMPYKQLAAEFSTVKTAVVQTLGAANLLVKGDNKVWHSHMLDGEAVIELVQNEVKAIAGTTATIIGCGGAGSACAFSLLSAGIVQLDLIDTDMEKADALGKSLALKFPTTQISSSLGRPLNSTDIVINASPVGTGNSTLVPFDLEQVGGLSVVVDLANSALENTALITRAKALGIASFSGVDVAKKQAPIIARALGFPHLFD
jgi:shikimate dehydrogenase